MTQVYFRDILIMLPVTVFVCWWLSQGLNGGNYIAITWVGILLVWNWFKESGDYQ